MEFPNLGEHCFHSSCNKLDFLPIKCEVCQNSFCNEHYKSHGCTHRKDNKVPVCPLCNQPVPIPPGVTPDLVVGNHIDNQCTSELSSNKKKVFTNKCIFKGCKNKEIVPILCNECKNNYCLKHRHPTDHQCKGKLQSFRERALANGLRLQNPTSTKTQTELDEILAKQLAQSWEGGSKQLTQEELDYELAKQLQMASQSSTTTSSNNDDNGRDRCNVS